MRTVHRVRPLDSLFAQGDETWVLAQSAFPVPDSGSNKSVLQKGSTVPELLIDKPNLRAFWSGYDPLDLASDRIDPLGFMWDILRWPEGIQLAVESGAKSILMPSENKRDVADVPDAVLTAIQWQFYDSPTRAALLALGLG